MTAPTWEEEIDRLRAIVEGIRASGRVPNDPASVEDVIEGARGERIEVTQRHIDALVSLGLVRPVRRRRRAAAARRLRGVLTGRGRIALTATVLLGVVFAGAWLFGLGRGAGSAIDGQVFVDFDGDGAASEPEVAGGRRDRPVPGVLVSLVDASERLVASATSDELGRYLLEPSGSGPYRLEFSEIPEDLFPSGTVGPTAGPVQFVAAGSTADLPLIHPESYCQKAPQLTTSCFLSGDHRAVDGPNAPGPRDAVVGFPWEATDFDETFPPDDWPAATQVPAARWTEESGPVPRHLASISEVGAVWGLAYDRPGDRVFASAMLKRHADLGDLGTGGIYVIDRPQEPEAVAEAWLDIASLSYPSDMPGPLAGQSVQTGSDPRDGSAGNGPLPGSVAEPSHDVGAFSVVGTRAFGDIDISDDGRSLWVVNLFDRTLLRVDVESASLSGAWPISDPGCATAADIRPWGLSVQRDEVHVGVVCSAQESGKAEDLAAHVLRWDGEGGFETELTIPLDYRRRAPASQPDEGRVAAWAPWVRGTDPADSPQPILSDIEFDDAGMTLALLDRQGHQWGHANYPPDTSVTTPDQSRATAGDLLRACRQGGQWTLEANGRCGGAGEGPQDDGTGPGGPFEASQGSAEFFFGEGFRSPFVDHEETALGSVASLAGSNVVASTILDPAALFSSGAAWLDLASGDHTHRYEVLVSEDLDAPEQNGTFGKASGLGDLEVICDPAPLVLGGRLWLDQNADGVHGAGEPPAGEGLEVGIFGPDGQQVATTTTDAQGYYEFRWVRGGPLVMPEALGWEVRVDRSQPSLDGLFATASPDQSLPLARRSRATGSDGTLRVPVPAEHIVSGRGDMTLSIGLGSREG